MIMSQNTAVSPFNLSPTPGGDKYANVLTH